MRHPLEQRGLGFCVLCGCMCMYLSDYASGGLLQQKNLNSTTNKESKQVLFLFSLLIHSFDIGRFFLSKGMCTYISV